MKSIFLMLLFSTTLLAEAYICNLDLYENLSKFSKNIPSRQITTMFLLDQKSVYQDTIGLFNVKISYSDDVLIEVTNQKLNFIRNIKGEKMHEHHSSSYMGNRSALKINCSKRTIGQITTAL